MANLGPAGPPECSPQKAQIARVLMTVQESGKMDSFPMTWSETSFDMIKPEVPYIGMSLMSLALLKAIVRFCSAPVLCPIRSTYDVNEETKRSSNTYTGRSGYSLTHIIEVGQRAEIVHCPIAYEDCAGS